MEQSANLGLPHRTRFWDVRCAMHCVVVRSLFLLLLVFGCGGDDSPMVDAATDVASASACGRAWEARCVRACECMPGDQCAFAGGTFRRDGGITAIGGGVVESMSACLSLERINCPDYDGTDADAEECIRQTETAACIDFEIDDMTFTGVEPLLTCPN